MTTTDETKITISKGNLVISSDRPRHVTAIGVVERSTYASSGYAVEFNHGVEWDLESLEVLVETISLLSPSYVAPRLFIYLDEGYNDDQA